MLTALLSAVVAGVISFRLATVGARRAQAGALRTAKKQFDREAEALIEARGRRTGSETDPERRYRDARTDLSNQLDEIVVMHRWWKRPREIRDYLDGEELRAAMRDSLLGARGPEGEKNVREARVAVRRVRLGVESVALAAQRPGMPHPGMWRRSR
ncbi:hypothetical protein [Actinoplanes couchii]|uniref:Secreted protein n=1 Tax=Actinoplanes couchii TaxID=403638 RepID=A0ABQ3WZY5_9ACTN|nr:hypothetical protein [Actinoplanes couchii]MDR6316224.1 hypothetical protein [Actinoplanes couchii]GID51838.1 hypothetical protein Aco03nite_002420 [Actinoplanes couchii]